VPGESQANDVPRVQPPVRVCILWYPTKRVPDVPNTCIRSSNSYLVLAASRFHSRHIVSFCEPMCLSHTHLLPQLPLPLVMFPPSLCVFPLLCILYSRISYNCGIFSFNFYHFFHSFDVSIYILMLLLLFLSVRIYCWHGNNKQVVGSEATSDG